MAKCVSDVTREDLKKIFLACADVLVHRDIEKIWPERDNAFITNREFVWGSILLALVVFLATWADTGMPGVFQVGASYFPSRVITSNETDNIIYLFLLIYMFLVALVGERLFLNPLLGECRAAHYPVHFFAGFVPGYFLMAAFNRIVTLFLSHQSATTFIGASIVLTSGGLIFSLMKKERSTPRTVIGIIKSISMWGNSLVLLWIVTIYFLQRQMAHIAGDAFRFFDSILKNSQQGIESTGRLAIISQHYDELSILYPIFYGILNRYKGDVLACYWLLYGFCGMGAICLVYICAKLMKLNTFEGTLVTIILFFGSFSLNPFCDHYLLFDSDNPLSQSLHPARIFGSIMPIIAVSLFMKRKKLFPLSKTKALILSALISCGIATTTISNLLVLVFLLIFCLSIDILMNINVETEITLEFTELVLAGLLFVYPLIAYINSAVQRSFSPYFLLIIIALFLFYIINQLWRGTTTSDVLDSARAFSPVFLGSLFGAAASLLVLGNVLIQKIATFLGNPVRIWGIPILDRPVDTAVTSSVWKMFGPYKYSGIYPLEHTYSPADFTARFGMVFLVAAVALVFLQKIRKKASSGDDEVLLNLFFLTASMFAFLVGLLGYDFMAAHMGQRDWLAVWLRSRLLEPWFYSIFFLFFVLQRKLFPSKSGSCFFILFTVYLIKGMLIYPGFVIKQWLINAEFFFNNIV